jgi:membrane-associated phospholipid phosphatase
MAVVWGTESNQQVFLWLNGLSRITGERLWAWLTMFGDALVVMVLLLPWVRRRSDIVWQMALAGAVVFLVSHGLKELFAVDRPLGVLNEDLFHIIGARHRHNAFPSGHTMTAFMTAGVFSFATSRPWVRVALVSFAALIGVSRAVVGVHWPLDILAGAALGWSIAWFGHNRVKRRYWRMPLPGRYLVSVGLLGAAIVLLFMYQPGYPHSLELQRSIALLCLAWGAFDLARMSREQRR